MSAHLCARIPSLYLLKCQEGDIRLKDKIRWKLKPKIKSTKHNSQKRINFWWDAIGCIRKNKTLLSGEEGRVRGHPWTPGRWGAKKRWEAMKSELSRTESIALLFIPSAHRVSSSIEALRRAPGCLQDTERLSGILISGLIAALCVYPHVWLQCPSGAAV